MPSYEEQKAKLERFKVGSGTLSFKGRKVSYYVTASNMPEVLENIDFELHLGYWGPGLLFVSEAVPRAYRKYALYHELVEFEELGGPNEEGVCVQASQEELQQVPANIRSQYVSFRRRQFRILDDLFGGDDTAFARNLRASLEFWRQQ